MAAATVTGRHVLAYNALVKTAIITAVFALATAAAFVLVLLNRSSEKIVTAVVPIAIAGLVGIYLAVFVFGGEPSVSFVFPASYQYQMPSKMPPNLPHLLRWRRFTQVDFLPAQLHAVHPEYFTDPSDSNGIDLYHHLLQRAILDWLAIRHSSTWQVEGTEFDLPIGRIWQYGPVEDAKESSTIYAAAEILRRMKHNKFASISSPMAFQLAVPPGTDLIIDPPHTDNKAGDISRIVLRNKFCTISLGTQGSSWMMGLGGFKELAGLSDDENRHLATATYRVRVSIEYNRFLSGSPKMTLYRTWAKGIAEGIKDQFDEQVIWTKAKSDYLFQKQLKQLGPLP